MYYGREATRSGATDQTEGFDSDLGISFGFGVKAFNIGIGDNVKDPAFVEAGKRGPIFSYDGVVKVEEQALLVQVMRFPFP